MKKNVLILSFLLLLLAGAALFLLRRQSLLGQELSALKNDLGSREQFERRLLELAGALLEEDCNTAERACQEAAQLHVIDPGLQARIRSWSGEKIRERLRLDSLFAQLKHRRSAFLQAQSHILALSGSTLALAQENDSMSSRLLCFVEELNTLIGKKEELDSALALAMRSHERLILRQEKVSIDFYGEVKNGSACGYGMGIFQPGGVYTGEWLDNLRHGRGKYIWSNGDVYEGHFAGGQREGHGTYYFATGEKFTGEWKGDLRHGYGTFYSGENEVLLKGQWINDRYSRSASQQMGQASDSADKSRSSSM